MWKGSDRVSYARKPTRISCWWWCWGFVHALWMNKGWYAKVVPMQVAKHACRKSVVAVVKASSGRHWWKCQARAEVSRSFRCRRADWRDAVVAWVHPRSVLVALALVSVDFLAPFLLQRSGSGQPAELFSGSNALKHRTNVTCKFPLVTHTKVCISAQSFLLIPSQVYKGGLKKKKHLRCLKRIYDDVDNIAYIFLRYWFCRPFVGEGTLPWATPCLGPSLFLFK